MRISAAFSKQTKSFVTKIPTRRLGRLPSVRILGRAELSVVRLCGEGMIQPPEMLLARYSIVGETLAAVVAHVARPTHPYNLKTNSFYEYLNLNVACSVGCGKSYAALFWGKSYAPPLTFEIVIFFSIKKTRNDSPLRLLCSVDRGNVYAFF